MVQLETIKFNQNWNNKLNCSCFTTFRLKSMKYQVNKTYRIELNCKFIGLATIKGLRTTTLSRVNDFITMLDCGLPVPQFVNMVKIMYKNRCKDPVQQEYLFILLRWDKKEISDVEYNEKKTHQPQISNAPTRV